MTTFTAGPKDGQSADWGLDAFGAQLAMLLSPAVRIEPELLRSVRLECLAHVDVGVEQDLWFSPMVSARSDAGITFAVETTLQLRQQLRSWYADDPATVEQARQVMARVHRGLSPLLLVEEQLAWAAVTGDRSAAERIAGLLVRAVSAGRPDIDHWLARVWRMMPPAARDGADGWVLGQVAAVRGAPVDAGPAPQWLDADQLRALLAGVADVPLNVAGTASLGYRLGVPAADAEVSIAVPDTAPRLLEIRGGAQRGTRRVELAPGAVLDVPPGPRPVEIRTARGAVYVLDGQVGTLADAVVVDLRGPSCSVPLPDGWIVIGTGDPDRVASLLPVAAGPALDLPSVLAGDPQRYGVGTFVSRGELPGRAAFAYGGLVPGRPVRTLAIDDAGLPHVSTVRARPPSPDRPALLETDGRRLLPGAPVVNDDGSLAGIVTLGGWIDDPPAALPAEMLRETLKRLQTPRSAGAHVLVVLPRSTDDEGPSVLPNKLRLPQAMADSLLPQGTLWVSARRGPRDAEWFELIGRIGHSTPTRTLLRRWEVEVGTSSDLTSWPLGGFASALLDSVIGRIDGQDSEAYWTVLSNEAAAALDECADRFPPGAATPGTTSVSTGPALRAGDMVVCPLMDGAKPHVGGPITPAASVPTVLIGGLPAAVANAIPAGIVCVSPAPNGIAMGSMTVLVGGFPAARLGDLSMHGTPVAPGPGCPTVLIGG